jgi:hypothetical protein
MAIRVGRIRLLFFVNSWIMTHFGIKPVRGGSPPRDIKVAKMIVVVRGVLFHMCDRDSVVVVEVEISSKNIVSVIRI